jgi:hypothetical protein
LRGEKSKNFPLATALQQVQQATAAIHKALTVLLHMQVQPLTKHISKSHPCLVCTQKGGVDECQKESMRRG